MAEAGEFFNPFEVLDEEFFTAIQRQLNSGTPEEVLHHQIMQQITSEELPSVSTERFASVTQKELEEAISRRIPHNTRKSTTWGYNIWRGWCKARLIDENIEDMDDKQIDSLLSLFVHEVRRQDGNEYPPNSLVNIVSGIQRHLRENGHPTISFYDKSCPKFDRLRKSLDAKMKELTRRGIGSQKRQAQPMELWGKKVFNLDTAEGLTNVVFWYSCKMFGLRAADEHRKLEVSQFSIGTDSNGKYLRFLGRSCKNFQGGLTQRKLEPKDLKIYSKPELKEKCATSIFEYYLTLIPPEGPFYRRPLPGTPPRYSKQVIGVNKLSVIVKTFCAKAGFDGYFTNHSGKVTCATELFKENIDEQLIMKQTGHRSQDAVRRYKRPSVQHEMQVSSILQPPAPKQMVTSEVVSSSPSTMSSSSAARLPPVFNFSVQGSANQNIYINYN